ncbi:hypothetical protein [Litorimonas taeanensis]|nr:hypothetical protein [Litorimonas taeanensis]
MGQLNISQDSFQTQFSVGRLIWYCVILCLLCIIPYQAKAQIGALGTGPQISEEEVYDNLDDLDLSLRYAKQQIKKGEMLNAGAALERMLYANPNWHSVRLLYAAVLYRLDDQKAALRELALLEGKALNPDQTETYTQYKQAFAIPPRKSFPEIASAGSVYNPVKAQVNYAAPDDISAQVTVGFRADDNAGNALTDESFGFDERGDVSVTLEARAEANLPLTDDRKVMARLGAVGHIRRHDTYDQADYDVYEARAGLTYRPAGGVMAVDVNARQVKVSGETYLNQIGPRASFSQAITDDSRAVVSLSVYSQDYKPLSFASREDERDGLKTSLQFGLLQKIKDRHKFSAAVGYETKSADLQAFAYSGPVAAMSYEHVINETLTSKSYLRARQLGYKENLIGLSGDRSDLRVSARTAMAIQLGSKAANVELNKPVLELGLNYTLRESNIDINDFNNLGADVKLSVSF